MQWFYAKDGQQHGPVDFQEILRLREAGELTGDSLVWQKGMPNWVKLSTLPATGDAPTSSGIQPPPATATAARVSALAIVALVLGVVSFLCCGPFFAIPAVVCGHLALGKIQRDPNLTGRGPALAGVVTGYLNILLYIYLIFFTDFRVTIQKAYEEALREAQAQQSQSAAPKKDD